MGMRYEYNQNIRCPEFPYCHWRFITTGEEISISLSSSFTTSIAATPCSPQPISCFTSTQKQSSRTNNLCSQKILTGGKFCFLKVKASASKRSSDEPRRKPNSLLCADCNGNGAVPCSQCKGNGVNSADYFNGKFKAGDSCWLCGGKKNMLCGNCNGAGFIGGFMTSSDT
ncbi:protein BUNDLE SHEATH DEFECTIVE 2, chloroplastic-like isoform X1 [Coffea arabica]|uniref:Protein BUNDLE SHEATH DEFECTIVE 2, chloroplastic-like isoform X1 n=2 Tax=Coffea arabica TaxID=13443 RepID=A0ABM4VEY7_COFAR